MPTRWATMRGVNPVKRWKQRGSEGLVPSMLPPVAAISCTLSPLHLPDLIESMKLGRSAALISIIGLDLRGTGIAAALALSRSTKVLQLEQCQVSLGEVLRKLVGSRTGLAAISFEDCDLGEQADAEALEGLPSLLQLSMWKCNIVRVPFVASLSSLSSLDLSSNAIDPSSLATALQNTPNLSCLDLSSNGLGRCIDSFGELCRSVSNCHALRWLGLSWNELGDAGAESVASMLSSHAALQSIDLRWNQIGENGFQAIITALTMMGTASSLQELQLDALWSINGHRWSRCVQACLALNQAQKKGKLAIVGKGTINRSLRQLMLRPEGEPNARVEQTGNAINPETKECAVELELENMRLRMEIVGLQKSHAAEERKLLQEVHRLRSALAPISLDNDESELCSFPIKL